MVEALPIGPDSIHRAAEEMIAECGPEALAIAKKRSQKLRSAGYDSVANTWDLIYEAIRDQQGSDHKSNAYKSALERKVFLSE